MALNIGRRRLLIAQFEYDFLLCDLFLVLCLLTSVVESALTLYFSTKTFTIFNIPAAAARCMDWNPFCKMPRTILKHTSTCNCVSCITWSIKQGSTPFSSITSMSVSSSPYRAALCISRLCSACKYYIIYERDIKMWVDPYSD